MLAVTRKEKIKDIILEKKSVMVSELSKKFSVTEETIRRDLKALEDEGILVKTYGGAYIQDGVQNDINVNIRESLFVDNKEKIATKCADLINHGDSIFLDASTTSLAISSKIRSKRVTVITNSLKIANSLSESESIRLMVIGGILDPQSMSFLGRNTINSMQHYYVDKAFISCRSISMDFAVTDSNEQQAEVRQLAIKRSNHVYLVVDHTKFNKTSFTNICFFHDINTLLVDTALDQEWKAFLTEHQVEIIECQ
ncbi:transcriptional regulator, DeoR family [Natronincola peptidivorans]|uniref:Transcriptional regulator, DeoR family n=1 Tax=Natronincola peptidivorans TaxID=426128 RepID=A0A1I0CZZ7_9FIRM|nr:DeoR/GlpR family DNA-binding transcription regulator [Natronincola peptidivorans]SET25243.1 transcriptional regulator, DeoR family [Natronincola peptidivorans]